MANIDGLDFGPDEAHERSFSSTARRLMGSRILQIAGDVREMQERGEAVLNLTVGDFDPKQFPIPDSLGRRIGDAIAQGHTTYPPANGIPELRKAVVRRVEEDWGVSYPADAVLVGSGARSTIYCAYRALVEPGDPVVFPVPCWNNEYYVDMAGATGVPVPTRPEHAFMPRAEDLEPFLADARLICLNTPSNPAGTVMDPTTTAAIAAQVVEENERRAHAGERHLYLLLDVVYSALVFRGSEFNHPVALVPESAPWVLSVDGISKGFSATGLRCGWVVGPPKLIAKMKSFIGHIGAWAAKPIQVAAAGFLDDSDAVAAFRSELSRKVETRLEALHRGFAALADEGYPVRVIEPQGAMFLSVQLDWIGRRIGGTPLDSNEAIRKVLLSEAGMAVVPFRAFGLEGENGWMRVSVGAIAPDDVSGLFPKLRALMDRLSGP